MSKSKINVSLEWHKTVDKSERDMYKDRFLNGIIMSSEINKVDCPHPGCLWDHIQNMENTFFYTSKSRQEYIDLLSEKAFEMMFKLEEEGKRLKEKARLENARKKAAEDANMSEDDLKFRDFMESASSNYDEENPPRPPKSKRDWKISFDLMKAKITQIKEEENSA